MERRLNEPSFFEPTTRPERDGRTEVRLARLALLSVCLLLLVLVTRVNWAGAYLAPGLHWLPDSRALSLPVCLGLYGAIRPARPFAGPSPDADWRTVMRVGGVWLAVWFVGSAVAAAVAGHWVRYRLAEGPAQLAGFLVLGPIQEELLFRGAI